MRKLSFVAVAAGAAILLYYFYLPTWLLMAAHKTEIGGGHFIIIFPLHADPVLRWHGVLAGASATALGAVGLFATRDRRRPVWKPALWLGVGSLFLGAIVTQTGIQSYVAQLPDPLDAQFWRVREQYRVTGYGSGWPAAEEIDRDNADYNRARGALEVVYQPPAHGEMSQASAARIVNRVYQDWQQACSQAALMDGATLSAAGMRRPQRWTKYSIIDPKTCRVYLRQQGSSTSTDWCIRKDAQGITTLYRYSLGPAPAISTPPPPLVRARAGRRG